MTPPFFDLLDASVISSIDYDTHIWNYHTLCAMSDIFINDKELWELATVDMNVMTVTMGVALVIETAAVIVLAVTTAALVAMTVTLTTLLIMQSTVTLDAVVLRLLPTTPSYHPP
ncbi:hypothetical protein DYB28_003722 [Aphanomyces astaci]|uniref:Uncharacterized protein n=1 Tax=Aphanomyces astaci TaxID=112090 RepID=A0A9X8HBF6_APHAT|nr:hypothetical protein DYB28_003722 [Aphanomyces astaci]